MAGAFAIDDFEGPVRIGFEAVDLDGERKAVHDDALAFVRGDDVWIFFGHRSLIVGVGHPTMTAPI